MVSAKSDGNLSATDGQAADSAVPAEECELLRWAQMRPMLLMTALALTACGRDALNQQLDGGTGGGSTSGGGVGGGKIHGESGGHT